MNPHLPRIATGFGLGLSLLVLSLWLSWQALVPLDFGYRLAYQWLGIEQHVQTYGPQNRYRQGFADTSPRQQKQLFGEIVSAIQNDGQGLRHIFYTTHDGRRHLLLRDAEAVHLQDVANLINLFDKVAVAAALLLGAVVTLLKVRRLPAPSIPQMLAGLGVLLAACALVLLIAGPTTTFYWLHTQIFPPQHEWFFYYQDSLMTTLMKAPDLFGFIASLWGLLATLILIGSYALLTRGLKVDAPSKSRAGPAQNAPPPPSRKGRKSPASPNRRRRGAG